MRRRAHILLLTVVALLACIQAVAQDSVCVVATGKLPITLPLEVAEVPLTWTIGDSITAKEWSRENEQTATKYDGRKLKFLMRAEFSVDSAYEEPIYVCVPPTRYVCRGYINGCLFMLRGDDKIRENSNFFHSASYILPSTVVKKGQTNEIIIELTTFNGNRTLMPTVKLADGPSASRYVIWRQFFNICIPFALFVIGVFNAIFFTIVFFVSHRRYKRLRFALFALMSLAYSLTYVDYAFTSNYANSGFLLKLTSIAMWLSLQLSAVFIFELYNIVDRWKRLHSYLLWFAFGTSVCYLLWALLVDVYAVANSFNQWTSNIALPIVVCNVLICAYYTIRETNSRNVALLSASIVVSLCIAFDRYAGPYNPDLALTATGMLVMIFTLQCLFIVDFERLLSQVSNDKRELKEKNEAMERMVGERTREIMASNSKLNETIRELRDANAMKDRFFSIMAHDIKNPLGAIMGFSDLLVKHHEDYDHDDRMDFCSSINTCAYGLYKMLENLLEWSRLQVGTTKCSPVWFEASKIEETLLPIVSGAAESKSITLHFKHGDNALIYGDQNMVITICRNLVTNAIKFSYPGGEVTLSVDDGSQTATLITVADHGVGMSREQINKLFKIDMVASTPGTNQEPGSGIGLILCNEFIRRQGGTIVVESEKGKGSYFIVSLPKPEDHKT